MVRTPGANVGAMSERRFFDDLTQRINEALRNSPAQDIEKNLRALLASWFDRMDLVMREDFEVQKKAARGCTCARRQRSRRARGIGASLRRNAAR